VCVIFACCLGWLAFLKFFLKTQTRTNQAFFRQNQTVQLDTNLSHIFPPQYPGQAAATNPNDTYILYNLNGDCNNNMNTYLNTEKPDDLPSYLEAVQNKSHQ
jgi:hypothetical protein